MTAYTNNPKIDKILTEAEDLLADQVGRYHAKRFVGVFCRLPQGREDPRNIWIEVFEAGKEKKA